MPALTSISRILQDITERKLTEQAAEIEARYQASAHLLLSSNNLTDVCFRVAQTVVQELAFAECGIWLIEENPSILRCLAYVGQTQLAQMMQGSLELDSAGVGQGTTLILTLPLIEPTG